MHITLRQLEVFAAIVQAGTLAAAAERLCISKAAISMALQELERQLGCPLFDRIRNRLQLNPQGQLLLPLADEVCQRVGHIGSLFASGTAHPALLRIGASNTIGNYLLPRLLAGFMARHPTIRISPRIDNSRALEQALCDYELDLALMEGTPQAARLSASDWLEDQLIVAASGHHPLAARTQLTLADLEAQDWLLREPGSGSREQFQQLLGSQLTQWHTALELNTTESIVNGVSEGLGLALLSRLATQQAEAQGRLKALPLNLSMTRTLRWVIHGERYQSPALQHFIDHCRQWQTTPKPSPL